MAKSTKELALECVQMLKSASNSKMTNIEITKAGFCAEYLQGYMDGLAMSRATEERKLPHLCLPNEGVQLGDLGAMIVEWTKREPTLANNDRRGGVYTVLGIVYRCPGQ